jgi:hypothetical protein
MADIFKVLDDMPVLTADAQTVKADVDILIGHIEKVILPDLKNISNAVGRMLNTATTLFPKT